MTDSGLAAGLAYAKPARFLFWGGFAAAVNWVARIGLSLALPFQAAVALAYGIGMAAGFVVYRRYVWPDGGRDWRDQLRPFIAVNLAGAVIVLVVATTLEAIGRAAFGSSVVVEAFAHGGGIAVGAVVNYLGHGRFTFGRPAVEAAGDG